jgi:hypothetical protein
MASRKEEESEQFKVVDRRLFTSDGERRPDAPPEAPEPAPPPAAPRPSAAPERPRAANAASATASSANSATASAEDPAAAAGSEKTASQAPPGPVGAVQFEHLIMSLVSSAMYQLGMAARPGEIAPPPDLHAAQETIDILGLLQQKTKGNLTREEDELLTGSLQELRLAFVEMARRAGRIR